MVKGDKRKRKIEIVFLIIVWLFIFAAFAFIITTQADAKEKSLLEQCIEDEMNYWENITIQEARRNCLFLIRNDE